MAATKLRTKSKTVDALFAVNKVKWSAVRPSKVKATRVNRKDLSN